jgi:hypothetical protein
MESVGEQVNCLEILARNFKKATWCTSQGDPVQQNLCNRTYATEHTKLIERLGIFRVMR